MTAAEQPPEEVDLPTLRQRALYTAGRVAAPVLLRLSLGRWPRPEAQARFARAFSDPSIKMPPMFSGLLGMPGGRDLLRHAAAYAWHGQRGSLDPNGPPDLGGNLFTAWTGPPVSFVHIEKCGGIAVMRWLSTCFHPEQINRDDHRDLPPHLCYRTPALAGTDMARTPLVWGHYDAPTLRRVAPAHLMFTFLREPRARLRSLYHFWRSVEPTQLDPDLSFSVMLAHRLSLLEFLQCDDPMLLDLTDNIYVRRLTGLYVTGATADPLADAPEAALAVARKALRELAFVGITERMDDSIAGLAARIGAPPPVAAARANVTAQNHEDPSGWFRNITVAEQNAEVEASLLRRTSLDAELYAEVFRRG